MHISFISIKMHIHAILLKCASSAKFKIEQNGDCALLYYSMLSLVSAELILYIIWNIFLYFSHSIGQTYVAIGITQNKYNSTIQQKYCSKHNEPGLIMV